MLAHQLQNAKDQVEVCLEKVEFYTIRSYNKKAAKLAKFYKGQAETWQELVGLLEELRTRRQ